MKRGVLFIIGLFLGSVSYAAYPRILISTSAGSDTAASGAGPATAVTGTNAAYTITAASDTILLTGSPDLSGVATDGSAAIWISTLSSTRQWSKIIAVDNVGKSVKVQDTFTLTIASATYAIGGIRKTINASARIGLDVYEGWGIAVSSEGFNLTASPFTVSPTLDSAAPPFYIESSDPINKATATTTVANGKIFSFGTAARVRVINLNLTCSNATKTTASAFQGAANVSLVSSGCYFSGLTNGGNRSSGNPDMAFIRCSFSGMLGSVYTGAGTVRLYESSVLDSAANGINGASNVYLWRSIIARANGDCIQLNANNVIQFIIGSTLHGCTGDGIDSTSGTSAYNLIIGNNITGNGGAGWNSKAGDENAASFHDFNNFGFGATANTGGAVSNITLSANELQVDPGYFNTSFNDFRVGGTVYGQWNSNPIPGTLTTSFSDIGASQHQDVGGRVAVGY